MKKLGRRKWYTVQTHDEVDIIFLVVVSDFICTLVKYLVTLILLMRKLVLKKCIFGLCK